MSDLDIRNKKDLINGYIIAENVVNNNYLRTLSNYEVLEIADKLDDISLKNTVSMFKIKQIVHKKDEDIYQKLSTIYNSVAANGSSIIMIIDAQKDELDIYVGVKSSIERKNLRAAAKTIKKGIDGNFDGSILEELDNDNIESLVSNIFFDKTNVPITVSAVSGVATIRNKEKTENKKFIQGIEKFIDSMQGSIYTAIFIADSLNAEDVNNVRNGYEQLYSTMSPFVKSNYTYNESDSKSVAESISKGMVESVTQGTSFTQNYTVSKTEGTFSSNTFNGSLGINKGSNISTNIGHSIGKCVGRSIGGSIGGSIGEIVGGAIFGNLSSSATTSDSISVSKGSYSGENLGVGYAHTSGKNTSESVSNGTSEGESESVTKGSNTQQSTSTTDTKSNGRMLQLEFTDKKASNLIEKIDLQLKRLKESEDFGMFNCSVYMLSADKQTSVIAANTYKALMIGEESSVEASVVNTWDETEEMQKYLRKFVHPIFEVKISEEVSIPYTAGSIVSGLELPLHIGFPQKSVSGIPVIEYAEFGRNILTYDNTDNDKFNLGHIYHMGKQSNTEVNLDTRSMTMHTFITGSTGSGKSNTIYKILDELDKKEVKFLVIEPAKGEYKEVFGGREDVNVYGSNPFKLPLLRINPFSFPKDIHVLEHIDRLVEIFNACWPMYAAMPAILKEAIEKSYEQCGWNLAKSYNTSEVYPIFEDLIDCLEQIIESSAYSADTKGDYKGALITRVKSLTGGLYGQILCSKNEISNEELFDNNVIIDLSRVGSSETKSLIMGILVMKLGEHRLGNGKINSELKHITVLEEAHNLLRRTSIEQSQDNSNLQGKAVEMLSNAIAEMRTYGEGFIIADQSPGLLDMSVIRNTNTKIILRLPDESDRILVGKAANLNDEQIKELPRLRVGVAAVYQNNWIEPVLCAVEEFSQKSTYEFNLKNDNLIPAKERLFSSIIFDKNLELSKEMMDSLNNWIKHRNVSVNTVSLINKAINNEVLSKDEKGKLFYNIFNGKRMAKIFSQSDSRSGYKDIYNILRENENIENSEIIKNIITIIFNEISKFKGLEEYKDRILHAQEIMNEEVRVR